MAASSKSSSSQVAKVLLAGEHMELHPHAALFWVKQHTLIIADLHLGKATHFRRHGMPVPQYVQDETLEKLTGLLLDYKPQRCLILGDLFHSDYNEEWEDFADLVLAFGDVKFCLVPGNHDRLSMHQFDKYGIDVKPEPFREGPFDFSHHPIQDPEPGQYNLAGHIHPSARLRDSTGAVNLPCFFFGTTAGVLPAFGSFTGNFPVQPVKGDRIFVLAGSKVIQVY